MSADTINVALADLTEEARKISPEHMRLLETHPRAKKKLRRMLAARGLSAEDIKSILNGTLPDSALPGLFGLSTPQN